MRAVFASFLFALLCACSGAPEQSPAPESPSPSAGDRVSAFLQTYQAQFFRGLPNAEQAATLAPHFSPRLNALFRDALAGQQAYKAKFPSDKPPMIDGDIFSSLFEGASSGSVDAVDASAERRRSV